MNIDYIIDDKHISAKEFIEMANQVWPRNYNEDDINFALSKTINITARDNGKLVGAVRILTDGVFFGTITEILVLPNYQRKGIGRKLMSLVIENTPTKLYFGAQPDAEEFYNKLGINKGITSYIINKPKKY